MARRSIAPAALLLVAATGAAAQGERTPTPALPPPHAADPGFAGLHDPALRCHLLRELQSDPAAWMSLAARRLGESFDADDEQAARPLLLAVERAGPAAAPIAHELLDLLPAARGASLQLLLRAIGAIGAEDRATATAAAEVLQHTKTPTGRCRQEWNLACARLTFAATSPDDRVRMLAQDTLVPRCAAAMWLARAGKATRAEQDALFATLRWALARSEHDGPGWRLLVEEAALAVLRCNREPAEREAASRWLLDYADPTVRIDAAIELRTDPGAAVAAVPQLVAALGDPHRDVVREVLVTLSFFGDEGLSAWPALRRLRERDDRELVQMADGTVRAIRKQLTTAAAAVADWCMAGGPEAGEFADAVVLLGPRAIPHLQVVAASAEVELTARCSALLDRCSRR